MWERLTRAGARRKSTGADVSVILHGPGRTPMFRIRIWPDLQEKLTWVKDADVSLLLGRDEHAGLLRIELDRLGDYCVRAPQGEGGVRQILAHLPEYVDAFDPVSVDAEIGEAACWLDITLPSLAIVKSPVLTVTAAVPNARRSGGPRAELLVEPLRREEPRQANQNSRPAENRVAPPPPPPPPPKPDAVRVEAPVPKQVRVEDAPDWLEFALNEARTPKVRKILRLLAGEGPVHFSAIMYAFSPALKESVADSLVSEVRRTVERAGYRLSRGREGHYSVVPKDAA